MANDDLRALVEELRAELAELKAAQSAPTVRPNWHDRTCTICGAPADVIDLDPDLLESHGGHNGEGYCERHADKHGIDADDHPHVKRPGPKRKS